jgi:hypothetical protein
VVAVGLQTPCGQTSTKHCGAVWQVQPGENGKEKTVLLSSVSLSF